MREQAGWIERVKPSERILRCQCLAVELSAVGVVDGRRRREAEAAKAELEGVERGGGSWRKRHNGEGKARME